MQALRAFLALALTATALAGCAETADSEARGGPPEHPGTGAPFANGTWPSGQSARDYIESYVMTHPYRVGGQPFQPFMDTDRTDLVALIEGFGGYQVVRHDYDGGQNILAIKNGTVAPHQWVVLSAHYDTIGAGVGTTV